MDLDYLREENRLARFHIASGWLFDSRIRAFLGQCVIVHAQRTFHIGDTMEYEAFHPDFPGKSPLCVPFERWVYIGEDGSVRSTNDAVAPTAGDVPLWSPPV